MIAAKLKPRGTDDWGCGDFGASRGDRTHIGEDLAANPGDEIMAPIAGTVTKLGYPYPYKTGFNYRYVQITDYAGRNHRVFYIDPLVSVEMHVKENTVIGIAQDISAKFSDPKRNPMINHVHYEILDRSKQPIDPKSIMK